LQIINQMVEYSSSASGKHRAESRATSHHPLVISPKAAAVADAMMMIILTAAALVFLGLSW
jgi:hypothetical protein